MCFTKYLGTTDKKPKYKTIYMHQLIMGVEGYTYIDHGNHNTLDNRKENLKITTNDINTKNRRDKNKNNTSGYRNVSLVKGKYIVQLQIDGKNTVLGSFDDVHEAGKRAEEMRSKYYKTD